MSSDAIIREHQASVIFAEDTAEIVCVWSKTYGPLLRPPSYVAFSISSKISYVFQWIFFSFWISALIALTYLFMNLLKICERSYLWQLKMLKDLKEWIKTNTFFPPFKQVLLHFCICLMDSWVTMAEQLHNVGSWSKPFDSAVA